MSKMITLNVGGTPDELKRINAAVEALAQEEDWPADMTFQVALVLEELEMNIMHYAYDGDQTATSQIDISSEDDRLVIEILDHGKPFNPLEDADAPNLDASLEERESGGLGIHLMVSMMDEVRYRRESNKNRLTLVKRRD